MASRPRGQSEDSNVSDNSEGMALGIIILAVVFHLFLIILVCYFVCCHKASRRQSSRNERGPLHRFASGPLARRHSVEVSVRHSQRRSPGRSSDRNPVSPAQEEQVISPPPYTEENLETRPITNFQISLLTRVRNHIGRLTRSGTGNSPPPPYRPGHEANIGGVENPAMMAIDQPNLPSYEDCLQRLQPWQQAFESGDGGVGPPSYDEVVKDRSAK